MLKKVFAVFPVFIFFAFSGLFVFASPSSPVVFSSGGSASTDLAAEKIGKVNQLWSEIKDEIKKSQLYFLTKIPIKIPTQDGKLYNLGPLYKAAQTELAISGSSLETGGAREKLLELVNAGLDSTKVNSALSHEWLFGFCSTLRELWNPRLIQELVKPKYAHLGKTQITIRSNGEILYKVSLEPLFAAVQNQGGDKKSWDKLPTSAKDLLIRLAHDQVEIAHLRPALANTALDLLWSGIKDELKKPEYAHLSKTPIGIDRKNYNLEFLLTAAKDDVEYAKEGSELPAQAKKKLQELVDAVVIPQKFKDALDVKNKKLDAFWSEIKSELKKPEYAHLSKTPILVNGNNYNLEPLFVAVKNEYGVLGSQLSDSAKNKLQSLVSADVQHQIFKNSLITINNQKLDDLWTQLKKILNQPEFSKWKDTSIKIKNKSYDLKLLFAAAKEKADVKASVLPLDTKLKLQELVNDQVTSKMVENQLLALNQAETEKNEQAEAEKNKQAKEKQQSQGLTIGLATGGSVLVAAGLGGFLYWFFKIRK